MGQKRKSSRNVRRTNQRYRNQQDQPREKIAASRRTSTRSSSSKKSILPIPKISTPKIDFSMKTNQQKFLFFSAFTVIAYGFAALFAPWETFGKLMMPILPAMGVTERSFSQLKAIPMAYFVYICHKAQAFDWPVWALFLATYT